MSEAVYEYSEIHEEGFSKMFEDLQTEGAFDLEDDPKHSQLVSLASCASILATLLRGRNQGLHESPSLRWLVQRLEDAARGEDLELLLTLFKPQKVRTRVINKERLEIAGYAWVKYLYFDLSLSNDSTFHDQETVQSATAHKFGISESTVRRHIKEIFPQGISNALDNLNPQQKDAIQRGYQLAHTESLTSWQTIFRFELGCYANLKRELLAEISTELYGSDFVTPFLEADEGWGFSPEKALEAWADRMAGESQDEFVPFLLPGKKGRLPPPKRSFDQTKAFLLLTTNSDKAAKNILETVLCRSRPKNIDLTIT